MTPLVRKSLADVTRRKLRTVLVVLGIMIGVGGLTAIATRHGLRLAVAPSADLERFLIGCEADLCLDIEQLREAGIDPLELIEAAPGRIRHVHMARVTPEVLAALRRHGYQGWITVEA